MPKPRNAQPDRRFVPRTQGRHNRPGWLRKPDDWDRIQPHRPITVDLEFFTDDTTRAAIIDNRATYCLHQMRALAGIVAQAQECVRDMAGGNARTVRVHRIGETR